MGSEGERELIRETVAAFVDREVEPAVAEADTTQTFPEDVWDGLAEIGLTGLTIPEEYGGFDADRVTESIVNEELGAGHLARDGASVHRLAASASGSSAPKLTGKSGSRRCPRGDPSVRSHCRRPRLARTPRR